MASDPKSQEGASESPPQSVVDSVWVRVKAERWKFATWAFAALLVLFLLFSVLDVRIKLGGESESGNPNFPAGGPAEFMYLDSGRVAAYLAQVNGGSFNVETVR